MLLAGVAEGFLERNNVDLRAADAAALFAGLKPAQSM